MPELESLPLLTIVGIVLFGGVFAGRLVKPIRLPWLMGFMLLGIILGPSTTGVLTEGMLEQLDFVTQLVLGFDDVSAIVIFGFALAAAKHLLSLELGSADVEILSSLAAPVVEISLSLLIGGVIGFGIGILNRKLSGSRDVFILTLFSVFFITGLTEMITISLVLTVMTAGVVVVNTQPRNIAEQVGNYVTEVTPFMFVLFFALAGAHIDIGMLPHLGLIGTAYIVMRSTGKIAGCWIGAKLGRADTKVSKYLGIGTPEQAGLAIGLALIALRELSPLGPEAESLRGR